MTHTILHPPGWAPAKGYANGIAASGRTIFVGGQIGWESDQVFRAHDFIGQMRQCLRNIVAVVEAAGGAPADIVRLTWYVKDKSDYLANPRAVGETYREVLGRNFPAMTMVVVRDLIEDEALLEIEATAVVPTDART